MTDDDHEILAFAAEHRLILPVHIAALLKIDRNDAEQRLAALAREGLTRQHRTHHRQPGHHQITTRGLTAIRSPLPEPRYETIRDYRQETAITWLTLAAQAGAFGPSEAVITERVMRHHDNALRARQDDTRHDDPRPENEPDYGVPLCTGLDQTVPRCYPHLMLKYPEGRVAIHLQTLPPAPRRLAAQITAYGADPQIAAGVYLVHQDQIGKTIAATVDQLGLKDLIHVQRFSYDARAPVTAAL